VFSAAPESRRIPYTVADRSARDAHPLAGAWLALLALPGSRLAASEVAELVSVDAIARRMGLEGEGRESLMAWIDALAIRFGLDADDRRRAGLGAWGDFAWRTGLDRIVLGYALGDDSAGAVLQGADGTPLAPHPGVEGQRAALAGRVARLVERLAEWRARLAEPRAIEAWQSLSNGLLEEFVDARPGDVETAAALASIRAGVERVVEAAKRGGEAHRPVPHAVFLAAVDAELGEPARHARFLAAGVTVCAMVPMRNVPFRIVCVLGLDDGEFPRREPEPSFHLMRAEPRAGDRTREDDDRYLFLESLLAARDAVHLSHVCINARDGSRRPPSAVVTDLVEFVAGSAAVPDDARNALVLEHPAAAWDPRIYRGGDRSRTDAIPGTRGTDHSYDDRWLPAASALAGPRRGPVPFAEPGPIAPDGEVPDEAAKPELGFAEVFAFYRNPPRDYLRRVLGVSLARERTIEDDEPQAGGGLVRYGVDEALLGDLVADPALDDATLVARLRARAKLRPGRAGLHDAQARIECVRRVVSRYRLLVGEASVVRRLARLETRRAILAGELEAVTGLGPVRLRAGASRLGDWVELALSMLALEAPCAIFVGLERDAPCVERLELGDLDPAWPEQVVACHLAARSGLAPLLRHASWCYAEHAGDPARALREALAVLEGHRGPRERETDAAAALVLRGREPAFGEAWEAAASVLLAPLRERIRSIAP
jgi:exodeoxyribonuclease V gamma subunit